MGDRLYCVVQDGARDRYQIPLALYEAGMLDKIITDFYTPDSWLAPKWRLPPRVISRLLKRHTAIPSRQTRSSWGIALFKAYVATQNKTRRNRLYRWLEGEFSGAAARYLIKSRTANVICYSPYWTQIAAAKQSGRWSGVGGVFVVHPLPHQIRQVLTDDRQKTALTYEPESEENLAQTQTQRQYEALRAADFFWAASKFTARGLYEIGISPERVQVIPYGSLDEKAFFRQGSSEERWRQPAPLRLLWVGQLAYRKGAHHLFRALQAFRPDEVSLSVVTRSRLPVELAAIWPPNARLCRGVSDAELCQMYQDHHLLVLPSLAEGFGLVYLEAMAQGLPVLATYNTGAADIVDDGKQGFIVEPGSSDAIARVIRLCLAQPDMLANMSAASLQLAHTFTWERFRQNIRLALAQVADVH